MAELIKSERVHAVDALRGFALVGIVIAHVWEQFISAPRPPEGWGVESVLVDQIITFFVMMFVSGKFYSIFALLFGISFAIMMDNSAKKGQNFSRRFVWRLAILGVFGLFHAALYRGDILTAYVFLGFFLPLFYNISNRVLWVLVAILAAGSGPYVVYFFIQKSTFLPWESSPGSQVVADYLHLLKTGSFIDVVKENLTTGLLHKFDFLFALFGRGYLTFAYFLVGMWLVRTGIVHNLADNKKLLKRTLWTGLACTFIFVAAMFASFAVMPDLMSFSQWKHVFAFSFYNFFNIAFTLFLISGFLLLYIRKPRSRLDVLAPYGKTALTNYILQSMIGTFIFFGWGLGLLGELHDWQTMLLAVLLISMQIWLSGIWLKKFKYGPLEWLWRCATYLQIIPIKKQAGNVEV